MAVSHAELAEMYKRMVRNHEEISSYHCSVCREVYDLSREEIDRHEPTDWLKCGHHWKRLLILLPARAQTDDQEEEAIGQSARASTTQETENGIHETTSD
jgi:threonine synthase